MANMFRDAGSKRITPNVKPEDKIQVEEESVEQVKKEETIVEEKKEPVVVSSDKPDKSSHSKKNKKVMSFKNASMELLDESIDKSTKNTYSIYLDDDIKAAIDKLAKDKHTSRSKIISILLRNALFEEN